MYATKVKLQVSSNTSVKKVSWNNNTVQKKKQPVIEVLKPNQPNMFEIARYKEDQSKISTQSPIQCKKKGILVVI